MVEHPNRAVSERDRISMKRLSSLDYQIAKNDNRAFKEERKIYLLKYVQYPYPYLQGIQVKRHHNSLVSMTALNIELALYTLNIIGHCKYYNMSPHVTTIKPQR